MLIILYFLTFEYAEGHHDPPLVTLFAVTELDLRRHDPEGILNVIIMNVNYERCEIDAIRLTGNNFDYFVFFIS